MSTETHVLIGIVALILGNLIGAELGRQSAAKDRARREENMRRRDHDPAT